MNNFLQKISTILIGAFLLAVVFGGGYFLGKGNSFTASKLQVTDASNAIDFDPFWKVWDLLDKKYAPASSTKVISNQDKVWGSISGLVDSLDDPYTQFLPPRENEQFETSIQGEFSGVGMEVGMEDGILTVIAPLKETPAEKSGVKSGDKIIAIDSEITQKMTIDEAVGKIRGEIGTEVVLTIFRENIKEPFEISITRDVINIPTLKTEIIDDVFVISLYNFSVNSSSDFADALKEFFESKKDKLVLDLRGNPGGFLTSSIDIASWFLPSGKTVVIEDFGKDQESKVFRSKGYDVLSDDFKMVVLVDNGSASASEILAGALKEHNVATVVGSQTFGKGSVQELIEITPETALKVTIARWLTPNGVSISDSGLEPDIVIDEVPEGLEIDLWDYQLQEALRIIKE